MNRFANSTPEARPSPLLQRDARQALTVFLSCLLLGAAAVTWRTFSRADNARTHARTEALARALAIEAQFNQAVAAADVLGALARQSGGAIPNFRQVATELCQSRPGLATLELQPGGVVSDIVPRAGFEQAIGFNVFAHPAYHPGAQAAVQARQLTLSGPLPLYRGEPGLVARVPVFQRARDGREVCWGFVAVSLRLQEALSRARLDALAAQGYDYLFFAPEIAGQRAATLAKRGQGSFARAEQQIVRAQNLEFRLAVQPRHGWVNWTGVLGEGLGVLGVSALLGLLVVSVHQGRRLGAALAESEIRLARGITEGKQAKEELLKAQQTAELARAQINQAERVNAQLKERLEAATRSAQETAEADRAKLQQAEATIADLQGQVESTARAAMEATGYSQGQLAQAAATAEEWQARLDASNREAKEAAEAAQARCEEKEQAIADLQTRLEAADHQATESAQATATRLSQAEQTIADLEARLEAAMREAEASRANLLDAEETIRELQSRQRAAEATEAPVVELTMLPNEARSSAELLAPSQPATAVPEASQPASPAVSEVAARPARRKKARPDHQLSLFGEGRPAAEPAPAGESHSPSVEPPPAPAAATPAEAGESAPAEIPEAAPARKEEKRAPVRPLPPSPPVNLSQLRKAVSEILPLLTGHDPGAKDCLKDNRTPFRSAFSPEGFIEFEQTVKGGDYAEAVQQLRKAARKHGISA